MRLFCTEALAFLQDFAQKGNSQGCGGRSSVVEPWFVVPVVAGSSPVAHPIFTLACFQGNRRLFLRP